MKLTKTGLVIGSTILNIIFSTTFLFSYRTHDTTEYYPDAYLQLVPDAPSKYGEGKYQYALWQTEGEEGNIEASVIYDGSRRITSDDVKYQVFTDIAGEPLGSIDFVGQGGKYPQILRCADVYLSRSDEGTLLQRAVAFYTEAAAGFNQLESSQRITAEGCIEFSPSGITNK